MLLFLKEFRTDFKTILPEKLQSWFLNENPPEQVHNSAGPVIHVQQMASMHPESNQLVIIVYVQLQFLCKVYFEHKLFN